MLQQGDGVSFPGWRSRFRHGGGARLLRRRGERGRRSRQEQGEGRSGRDTTDAFEDRLDRLEDRCEARAGDYDLLGGGFDLAELHLILGLTVLALGVLRPLWRKVAGLPPWSATPWVGS